ncbi:hypothetical protein BDY19DRAFT_493191 [Irpex rosettiformis]|uniref:Uncharacterized protein n=1 Tax=Irpex rosettiformis TaxID=378272 RepID=A0ACB8UEB3_9APHY|nr:hypothetical protein BDY19DRAFT_493191 [Irpex rosettiformis]
MSSSSQTASLPPSTSSTPSSDHTALINLSPGSVSYRRRSPPPPRLNLEGCKPILATATTTTNTPNNAASRPSTAFVFASSLTLRNFHNYQSPTWNPALLPAEDTNVSSKGANSVPSTGTVTCESMQKHGWEKPKLSPAQLARHSSGALDARCTVSSDMRAAGFVPLTRSSSSAPSALSTPAMTPLPTPEHPPHFPPMVFINPAQMTNVSMWDYQRRLAYGPLIGLGFTTANDSPSSNPAMSAAQSPSELFQPSHSYSPISSVSSSSLLLAMSGSLSNVTSVPSLAPQSPPRLLRPLCGRFEQYTPGENGTLSVYKDDVLGVDDYPFSRQLFTNLPAEPSPHGLASPMELHTMTASGSIASLAQSSLGTPPVEPTPSTVQCETSPVFSMNPRRPKAKSVQFNTPSFKSKVAQECEQKLREKSHATKTPVGITELCSDSPFAWYTDPLVLPRTPSDSFSGIGSYSSMSLASSNSGSSKWRPSVVLSREKSPGGMGTVSIAPSNPSGSETVNVAIVEQPRQEKLEQGGEVVGPTGVGREDVDEAVVEGLKGGDTESEKCSRHGRQRDKDKDWEIEREERREQRRLKMREAGLNAVSENGGTKPWSSYKSNKVKGKSPKATVAAYSEIFPPKDVRLSLEHPHILGSYDAVLVKERSREAGKAVKDQVLAHRERDREHARLTNRWSLSDDETRLSQKRRASKTMTLADMRSPHSSSSTSKSSARGRGRGHCEPCSTRGHSIGSVTSPLSDGETIVGDSAHVSQIDSVIDC